jgi:DNA-binding MarR family transcriptional regulator
MMATVRLSRLQKRILCWLAGDEKRRGGVVSSSYPELVSAVHSAKSNISHSLRLLERQGLIVVGRTPGGRAEYLYLTPEGRQKTLKLSGSYE